MVLKILKHLPWNHKKVVWNSGVQPGIFQGRIGFLKKRNFDKCLIYNTWKESPTEKHSWVFFLDTLKTAFGMTKFNPKINTVGTFFSSKSVDFTPLLPTSCVSGIVFLKCHKKNIDTVSLKQLMWWIARSYRRVLSNVAVFLISLFELKLDFYSVLYHNNTKTTF